MKKIINVLTKIFLVFLLAVNMIVLDSPTSKETSNAKIEQNQALFIPWNFRLFKKQYDRYGNFVGCWGSGNDCLVVLAGSNGISVSTEGIKTQ